MKRFLRFLKPQMTPAMVKLFEDEKRHGQVVMNRLRYAFFVFFIIAALSNRGTGDLTFNFIMLGVYFAGTMGQTLLLLKKTRKLWSFTEYLLLTLDYAVFAAVPIYYSLTLSPDNFAHALKNPYIFVMALPLAFSFFQYRLGLVLYGTLLFLAFYFSMVAYGFATDMTIAANWADYILGPGMLVQDAFFSRPALFLGLGIVLTYAIARTFLLMHRIGESETHRASLARYFSPDVAEELLQNPDLLNKGVRQQTTILFSDIRNFTALSETMQPDELSHMLSDFRGAMARAIFAHNGSLDKFIGDAVMAVFGTPRPSPEPGQDNRNAVWAGLAMFRELDAFNERQRSQNKPELNIGIGIHCGDVFAGNLGAAGHMEYTVIGDPVNTASRIESLCKKLKVDFLISDEVYQDVKDTITIKKMPRVRVKGKEEPLRIHNIPHPQTP